MDKELYLGVRTRAGTSSQGKQKVFFSCLKDDLDLYFDEIANDILKISNCAIYYEKPDAEYDDETLELYLNEMVLFVFPLTNKLLTTKNRAIEKYLPFALENHRAILPLKQEEIDENLFNHLFKSANFLDKNNPDPSAIGYSDKLARFLRDVLISDDLVKVVRTAFDAYIFISYRKKDRAYLNKFMNLIHENDFCRDVAIWNDEYLVPGRNFEESIGDMLKKSDMVAFGVTPNILEDNNWVLKHEYPQAVALNKSLMSAQLVPTNPDEFKNKYKDLPEYTDVYDREKLKDSLRILLKDVPLMQNDMDPMHDLNIGLAYLLGIDVEINHERGLRLIKRSADAGLDTAFQMLVHMYRIGDGVEINYVIAEQYQEKLTELYEGRRTKSETDAAVFVQSLQELLSYQIELQHYSKARKTISKLEMVSKKYKSDWAIRGLYICSHKLGDIEKEENNQKKAYDAYKTALKISEKNIRMSNNPDMLDDLSLAYERMGTVSASLRKEREAESYFRKALDIRESQDRDNSSNLTKRNVLVSLVKVGEIEKEKGDYKKAEEDYKRAIDIAHLLNGELGSLQSERDLSTCMVKLAEMYEAQNRWQEAATNALGAVQLTEITSNKAKSIRSKKDYLASLLLNERIAKKRAYT